MSASRSRNSRRPRRCYASVISISVPVSAGTATRICPDMTQTCQAPGCTAAPSSFYSPYCSVHRGRLRRQGAVDQRSISKTDLSPYVKLVEVRIAKNSDSPAWNRLDDAWRRLVAHANGILAAERQGRPGIRYERTAAREIVRLADSTSPRAVVVCTLAMFVMWMLEPRRFVSDDGFRAQLVRRVLRLTSANSTDYFDRASGERKRVYRDLAPRALRTLGAWLASTLGGAGVHLARLEQRDAEAGTHEKQQLHAALAELK